MISVDTFYQTSHRHRGQELFAKAAPVSERRGSLNQQQTVRSRYDERYKFQPIMATAPTSLKPFCVPPDGHLYYEDIVERCNGYINCGIWEGLDKIRLRAWLTNFRTDKEKYFAACVLDALIFRSEKQTISLFQHLFLRVLPDLARLEPGHSGVLVDAHTKLKRAESPVEPGMRLVSVTKLSDPLSKSSPTLLRHLKRHLQIDERWMIKPSDIPDCLSKGIGVFVFIDDLLGTGERRRKPLR